MFRPSVALRNSRHAISAMRSPVRNASSVPTILYNNLWRKSNILYITYIVVGCIGCEILYGSVTGWIWNSTNQGVFMKKYFSNFSE